MTYLNQCLLFIKIIEAGRRGSVHTAQSIVQKAARESGSIFAYSPLGKNQFFLLSRQHLTKRYLLFLCVAKYTSCILFQFKAKIFSQSNKLN